MSHVRIYHYHITVECDREELINFSKLLGAKATTIDLHRDARMQIDRMLTKYSTDLADMKSITASHSTQIHELGYEVKRAKIEEVLSTFVGIDIKDYLYLEAHIKVADDGHLPDVDGFSMSTNPFQGNRFYNARIYTEEDLVRYWRNIKYLPNIVKTQLEGVVYDSNQDHDKWWSNHE
jgi:hypothetical protein